MKGKKIILGITASIAAYKTAELVRLLIKAGAEVKVVMTPDAQDFITPLTLSTLSKNPVAINFIKNTEGEWNNHVALALWGDMFLIAPATANTIAKMATGICDNLLMAVYLSSKCKVMVAPAMDLDMWKHNSVIENIEKIKHNGVTIINPGTGELASGLNGVGRMEEPEAILNYLQYFYNKELPLHGQKVLLTAGPTYENIDPVRFIGNRSSGKMGFALAECFAAQGAHVTLICGPTHLQINNNLVQRINVESAHEMYESCMLHAANNTIIVMSAAVADYKPEIEFDKKIKKKDANLIIALTPTADILNAIGEKKTNTQILIGFALETNNELQNAKLKLEKKNLDIVVLNSLNDFGAGFNTDTNKITIIDRNNNVVAFNLKSKQEVANDIVNYIIKFKNEQK